MALQFFDCINSKFIRAVHYIVSQNNTAQNCAVTVFGGTQPTAAQIAASWSTYSAQYLVHWTNVLWFLPPAFTTLASSQVYNTQIPAGKAAFRSGTATWAIIWNRTNVSEATIQGATLPSLTAGFTVVPVTNSGGNGVVRLTTTSIVSGTSYQPADITLRFGRAP